MLYHRECIFQRRYNPIFVKSKNTQNITAASYTHFFVNLLRLKSNKPLCATVIDGYSSLVAFYASAIKAAIFILPQLNFGSLGEHLG